MKLKEKRHKYLQKRALDKAIHKLIGDYGKYYIYDWGMLVFNFDVEKLKSLENLEFNLPSKEQIINEAKSIYKNFDSSDIKKVQYNFSFFGRIGYGFKDQNLILNANGSNIKLSCSSFNSIKITEANKVFVYSEIISDINIKSKSVVLYSINNNLNCVNLECDKIILKAFARLYAKKIIFKALNIDLGDDSKLCAKTVILRAKTINSSYRSYEDPNEISGQKIMLDADFIDIKGTILDAEKEIIIKNKSCNYIQTICSPKIVYNGKDISHNDEIVIQKLRHRLISTLKEIKDNVSDNIESYAANEQFTKILKK